MTPVSTAPAIASSRLADPVRHAALAQAVLGEEAAVDPGSVSVRPIEVESAHMLTGGLWRVSGVADTGGERRPWSAVAKLAHAMRHSPVMAMVPEPLREFADAGVGWDVEPSFYASHLPSLLPDGLRSPRLLGGETPADGYALMWLEDVAGGEHAWDVAHYRHVASLLGALAGRSMADPQTWRLPREFATVEFFIEGRLSHGVLPLLRDETAWEHPALRAAGVDGSDDPLRARLLELADRVPAWVRFAESLPPAFAHGDASPSNLMAPTGGRPEVVAIDWAMCGAHWLGADLAQLLVGRIHSGELDAAELDAVSAAILEGYQDGLAREGAEVDAAAVRAGFLVSVELFSGFGAVPLEELRGRVPGRAPMSERTVAARVGLSRWLVERADELPVC